MGAENNKAIKNANKNIKAAAVMLLALLLLAAAWTSAYAAAAAPGGTKAASPANAKAAAPVDIKADASYAKAVQRLVDVGIMGVDGKGRFNPGSGLTREEFAKIMVIISGLGDIAESQRGSALFPDVPSSSAMSGYINEAVSEGYINGMADDKFHPGEAVTYSLACIAMVKALGYGYADIGGASLGNYISKASALGLTEGMLLKAGDTLPRWAAALMTDRLLVTATKSQAMGGATGTFADAGGAFTKAIVLDTPDTSDEIAGTQVRTDKGIYFNKSGRKLIPGGTYLFAASGGNSISKASELFTAVQVIKADMVTGVKVTYSQDSKTKDMTLQNNITYWHGGQKIPYEMLKGLLRQHTVIVLSNISAQKPADSYAIIYDPAASYIVLNTPATLPGLAGNQVQTDQGVFVNNSGSALVPGGKYEFTTVGGGITKASGPMSKLSSIYVDAVKDMTVTYRQDRKKTNMILPVDITYWHDGQKISYDSMKTLIQAHSTIILAYNSDNSGYDYAIVYDPATSITVLDTPSTSDALEEGQVLTDAGVLNNTTKAELEAGAKYWATVDSSGIAKVDGLVSAIQKISVDTASGMKVTYRQQNGKVMTLALPTGITYWYNGQKTTYDGLKGVLQSRSSIVLGYNYDKTSYEYAVIYDPVYSKPETVKGYKAGAAKIGSMDVSGDLQVMRNKIDYSVTPAINTIGEVIGVSQIKDNTLLYRVSDIWGGNAYLIDVDHRVEGRITGILPGRASPKTIKLGDTNYDIGADMDVNKITRSPNLYKIGDTVDILLGYDGKVADAYYAYIDSRNYAFVISASEAKSDTGKDAGKVIYTVKLLFADNTTETYRVTAKADQLKGKVVSYAKVDDQTLALTALRTGDSTAHTVHKDDMLLDGCCVADNVTIFNILGGSGQAPEARAELLNWGSMPEGRLAAGKVLYINKSGVFDDITLLVTSDLLNGNYRAAYIKKETVVQNNSGYGTGCTYDYTLMIDGAEYQASSNTVDAGPGKVLNVNFAGGGVQWIYQEAVNLVSPQNIQAIDTRRIKADGKVYLFRGDIQIYCRDVAGNFTLLGVNQVDISKSYASVKMYFDSDPAAEGSRISMIILLQ